MKEFKILETEVVDQAYPDENDNYPVSGVSVLVKIEIEDDIFYLDFQTSTTMDYGAISSKLRPYDGTTDYDKLADKFEDDILNPEFQDLLDRIEKESRAQELWDEYISENYERDESHYGGMDANSEMPCMRKKP